MQTEDIPICPDKYPYCMDPEIMKIGDIGLDPTQDEPIVLDDYRLDKTKPDLTYFNPATEAVIEPPTPRSIAQGNEILTSTYCDDDPKNAWVYQDPKGPFISLVAKHEWGAAKVKSRLPLHFPVSNIRFHQTGTESDPFPEGIGIVKSLQTKSIQEGLSDIPYNFLIGEDGQLYEGRGWYVDAERSPDDANLKSNCLEVAYMGNFKYKHPPWTMVETALDVIRHGLQTHVLSPAFKAIPFQIEKL